MDVSILGTFLSPILTVTTVWNTGETGDIKASKPGLADEILEKYRATIQNHYTVSVTVI